MNGLSLVAVSRGYFLSRGAVFLIAVASLVVEHEGSVVVAHGL